MSRVLDYLQRDIGKQVDTLQGDADLVKKSMDEKLKRGIKPQGLDKGAIGIEGGITGPPEPTLMDSIKMDAVPVGEAIGEVAEGVSGALGGLAKGAVGAVGAGVDALSNVTDDYPNFWVGAAPMLMGALMGDVGEGARAGSEGLLQRYKDDRDAKVVTAKADKAAKETKQQAKKVWNPETASWEWQNYDPVKGTFTGVVGSPVSKRNKEDLLGAKEASDIRMGKNQEKIKGPQGRQFIRDKVTGKTRAVFPEARFSPKQQTHIGGVRKKLNADTEKQVDSYRRLAGSLKSFKGGNDLGAKTALKEYAKHVEGGQRLSDFDVEFLQYAFGTRERGLEALESFRTGKMSKRLESELAASIARGLQESRGSIVRKFSNAYRSGSELGLESQDMREILGAPKGLFKKAYIENDGKVYPVDMDDLKGILNQPKYRKARIVRYE